MIDRILGGRGQIVNWSKWEQLLRFLGNLLVVLDPEFDEALEIDQRNSASFLRSCFALGISGEASR